MVAQSVKINRQVPLQGLFQPSGSEAQTGRKRCSCSNSPVRARAASQACPEDDCAGEKSVVLVQVRHWRMVRTSATGEALRNCKSLSRFSAWTTNSINGRDSDG